MIPHMQHMRLCISSLVQLTIGKMRCQLSLIGRESIQDLQQTVQRRLHITVICNHRRTGNGLGEGMPHGTDC